MDQPRGVEGDRLVGGDVADHDVAALGPRHGDALGERGGMADELEDDVAAAPCQVPHRLRAGVARGEVVAKSSTFTTWSAPKSRASCKRSAIRSRTTMRAAPRSRATAVAKRPSPPAPWMTTVSPGSNPAW